MEEPTSIAIVKLIVKASNQQYDDQTIECNPNWTVRKLKEHLNEVYPSKPKPDDQKLIYSGQLLKDKLILKDVLRHFEGVQTQIHTFHLVCTPKLRFPSTTTFHQQKSNQNANDGGGLRQRHNIQRMTTTSNSGATVADAVNQNSITSSILHNSIPHLNTTTASSSMPVSNNCPTSSSPFMTAGGNGNNIPLLFNPVGFQQQFIPGNDYMLAQQVAMQNWMQQAYVQYMNQYMNLLSTGVRPETVFMQNQSPTTANLGMPATTTNSGLPPYMPYLPQNFPFMMNTSANSVTPNFTNNSSINPPNSMAATVSAAGTSVPVSPVQSPVQQQQQQQVQPQPQPQPPQNQPRFPNLMQDDLQENRDWLDVFYSISRLMVLLTLVYLYSSPLRCLLVFFIGLGIYIYHVSYFRAQRQQQDDNNNNGAGAVRRPQQNDEVNQQQPQQQQQVPQVQQNNTENDALDASVAAQTNNNNSADATATPSTPSTPSASSASSASSSSGQDNLTETSVVEDTDGTSMIAFLKTFVVSFIVSLLPETPPV